MPEVHPNEIAKDLRDVVILANRKAGSGAGASSLEQFRRQLEKDGFRVSLETEIERFKQAVETCESERTLRCVVAAGGDGTAELVANLTTSQTPLVVFPMADTTTTRRSSACT